MRAISVAPVMLGLALVGCERLSEPPTGVVTPPHAADLVLTSDEAAILEAAGIPVLTPAEGEQGATGGFQFRSEIPGFGIVINEIAFSAVRHRDGSVSGQVQTVGVIPGQASAGAGHTRVVCLAVNGNRATLLSAAQPVDPDQPLPGGSYNFFAFSDNGAGGDDPPDTFGAVFFPPNAFAVPAREVCSLAGTPGGTIPITKGNIQVRP